MKLKKTILSKNINFLIQILKANILTVLRNRRTPLLPTWFDVGLTWVCLFSGGGGGGGTLRISGCGCAARTLEPQG